MRSPLALALLALLVALGGTSACGRARAPSADGAPPAATSIRLSPSITLREQALALRVDPRSETFGGTTTLTFDQATPSPTIVLHGRDLAITKADVRDEVGVQPALVRTRRALGGREADEELVLDVRRAVAGRVTLELAWTAPFARLRGLYRVKVGAEWYAFTQLEAVDARRMFPSFDEPRFKAPWSITVDVPSGMSAHGNTPVVRTEPAAGGFVRHVFEKTRPLPSYLIALAVGRFEVLEATRAGAKPPIRLIAPRDVARGRGALAEAASDLVVLEAYFGRDYPYGKLDLVAVPDFGPGAMENPGLVTFREELLLADDASTLTQRRRSSVLAHELAHMWFGDLVTMKWWDDLWLNEGFATWMGAKVCDATHPGFGAALDLVAAKLDAMSADELPSARPVRLPVETSDAIHDAGGWSAYAKGAAVLGMLEQWMGADAFRGALRHYVAAHADGSATAEDLFAALDAVDAAKKPPPSAIARPFLERTGVPRVRATCVDATHDASQLSLADEVGAPTFGVPVCWKQRSKVECAFVDRTPPWNTPPCRAWIGADALGYYRPILDGSAMPTSSAEEIEAIGDAWAAVERGTSSSPELFRVVAARTSLGPSPQVFERAVAVLTAAFDRIVPDDAGEAFRHLARRLFAERARDVGFVTRPGDPADVRLLRAVLFAALWDLGRAPEAAAAAEPLARAWLADPSTADRDLAPLALRISAAAGGSASFDALHARLARGNLPAVDRTAALGALASLPRAELPRVLELVARGEVQPSDFRYVWGALARTREGRAVGAKFVRERFEELRATLGAVSGLAGTIGWACDPGERTAAMGFFLPKLATFEGMQRSYDEGVQTSARCIALQKREADDARAWLVANDR